MSNEKNPFGYIHLLDSFTESQRRIMDTINQTAFTRISNMTSSLKCVDDMLPGAYTAVQELAERTASNNAVRLQIEQPLLSALFKSQYSMFAQIQNTAMTGMLEQFSCGLMQSNFRICLEAIERTLKDNVIEAANMAFFKITDILSSSPMIELPSGLRSSINDLTQYAAKRLSTCENISFVTNSRRFIDEKNSQNSITISETNHICAAADTFQVMNNTDQDDPLETELMDFMTFLQNTPTRGCQHPVGRKIEHIVDSWGHQIDFDCSKYYHARSRKQDDIAYTYNDMLNAPNGITCAGRFNFTGQAYYYFSNTPDGAVAEVKKHLRKENCIQVCEIKPNKRITLIDLSGDWKCKRFLRYIRYPVTDYSLSMPREYLIPCFVSDCCRSKNIDGIKYCGNSEYNNYVTWNPGYFSFSRMII